MTTSSSQLINLVVLCAEAGEGDILPGLFSGPKLALARELFALVRHYNYVDSVSFAELTDGKSPSVVAAWRRRLSNAENQPKLTAEFFDHLDRILLDGQVERYLPASAADKVASIRRSLALLDAP